MEGDVERDGDAAGEKTKAEDGALMPSFREAEQAILRGEGIKRRRRAMSDEREAGTTSEDEDGPARAALRRIEKIGQARQAAAARWPRRKARWPNSSG